jgi:prefoldin subunit 5
MGMESFNASPTKESLQSRLEDLKKQKENYMNRLVQAQDTPVSNMFSEGEKDTAIKNHQNMLDNINSEAEEIEKKLSEMG